MTSYLDLIRDGAAREPWGSALRRLTHPQMNELSSYLEAELGTRVDKTSPTFSRKCDALMLAKVRELEEDQRSSFGTTVQLVSSEFLRRIRSAIVPPPTTASNIETCLMSRAYVLGAFDGIASDLASAATQNLSPLDRISSDKLGHATDFLSEDRLPGLLAWGRKWLDSSFARLEVGHKLAASLALTDVPGDMDIFAPWETWSLVLPDGMFGVQRIWLNGTVPWVAVVSGATSKTPYHSIGYIGECTFRDGGWGIYGKPSCEQQDLWYNERSRPAIYNLIRGACLALSNPEKFRKERRSNSRLKTTDGRLGPPDLQQARFLLSAPVRVDLRSHLRDVLSGKSGASPTVQFLVRGHWRNQPHGPRGSLRRQRWIEPFWKGPEDSRVLLRQHQIVEPQ